MTNVKNPVAKKNNVEDKNCMEIDVPLSWGQIDHLLTMLALLYL